jgi:hypothetical protein
MRSLVVLSAMLVFVVMMRRRPAFIILAAILLWLFIPYVAIDAVWGSTPRLSIVTNLHPATMLVLIGFYVVVLKDPKDLTRYVFRSGATHFALAVFLIAIVIEYLFVASSHLGVILDQIIGPLVAYVLLRFDISRHVSVRRTVIFCLIGAAAAQASLVIVQSTIGRMIPYEHYYFVQTWFSLSNGRWFGTLDHPLVLGLFLACMTFLLAEIPSVVLRCALATTFMIAILLSQSRTALMICAIGLVFLVLRSGARPWQRLVLVSAAIATPITMWSAFASSDTYNRFVNDGGSAGARTTAAGVFFSQGLGYLFHGGGSGYSFIFGANTHLTTSLENPFLMYTLDFGLIPTILYFGPMFWLVMSASYRRECLHITFAATAAIVLTLSFSSIAAEGASAFVLWTILALLPRRSATFLSKPIGPKIEITNAPPIAKAPRPDESLFAPHDVRET